jgi:hypothetical protein
VSQPAPHLDHLPASQAAQGFLDKSDGRDKLLATVQYAALFICAGEPGNVRKVQASVTAARKVFRIMRPLESLHPLLLNPAINPSKPLWLEVINKIKPILMAVYFGGDHVVWAQNAGLTTNKALVARFQKASLYGWFGGSLCTLVAEIYEISRLTARRKNESDEDYARRQQDAHAELTRRTVVLVHACFQALLAMGLLELRPWKKRTVGVLGVAASLINCYMLYPGLPRPLFGGLLGRRRPEAKTA